MTPLEHHERTARRVVSALAARHGARFAAPVHFPTDSSHSVFYVTESDAGPALVKLVVDDFLAVGTPPLAQEYRALELASAAGLAPAPLHVSTRDRALAQRFVPWPTSRDWSTPGLVPGIGLAAALMPLAGGAGARLDPAHLDLDADLRASRRVLAAAAGSGSPAARSVAPAVLLLLPRVRRYCRAAQPDLDALPLVFSHNDVSPDNTISGGGGSLLIDFETASLARPDFLFGQLAVDVALEDALAGRTPRPAEEVWEPVAAAVPYRVGARARWARVAERLVQNVAYALRQLTAHVPPLDPDYRERKAAVARHGAQMLASLCRRWTDRGEAVG